MSSYSGNPPFPSSAPLTPPSFRCAIVINVENPLYFISAVASSVAWNWNHSDCVMVKLWNRISSYHIVSVEDSFFIGYPPGNITSLLSLRVHCHCNRKRSLNDGSCTTTTTRDTDTEPLEQCRFQMSSHFPLSIDTDTNSNDLSDENNAVVTTE